MSFNPTDPAGGDGAGDLLAQHLAVLFPEELRRFKRGQNAHRQTRIGAGGENRKMGGRLQDAQTLRGNAPFPQTLPPQGSRVCRGLLQALPLAARDVGVDPGLEILGSQLREVQQHVGDIALGVDHQGGDAVESGFFQQVDTQAGLARASHAHHHGMGGQVLGIVKQRLSARLVSFGIEYASGKFAVCFRRSRLVCVSGLTQLRRMEGVWAVCPRPTPPLNFIVSRSAI
jgi:hypothetical protein